MNIEEWSGYEVSNEVLEQAALWIAALDNTDNSHTDMLSTSEAVSANAQVGASQEDIHTRFFEWLQADPSHQQAYFELSEIWARSACTKSMVDMLDKSVVLPFPTHTDGSPRSMRLEPCFGEQSANSSWTYSLTIGLIFCGLLVPIVQSFL